MVRLVDRRRRAAYRLASARRGQQRRCCVARFGKLQVVRHKFTSVACTSTCWLRYKARSGSVVDGCCLRCSRTVCQLPAGRRLGPAGTPTQRGHTGRRGPGRRLSPRRGWHYYVEPPGRLDFTSGLRAGIGGLPRTGSAKIKRPAAVLQPARRSIHGLPKAEAATVPPARLLTQGGLRHHPHRHRASRLFGALPRLPTAVGLPADI